jgi:hypothetical protein
VPVFVHLTSHRNLASIRRGGIGAIKKRLRPRGVYALPVTPNFQISHQWLRELRRLGGGTIVGVYFRVPDDEPVEVGHYDSLHISMTAAEAVGLMMATARNDPASARALDRESKAVRNGRKLPTSPEGFEVIIPRVIAPSEIVRVKALPQVVGWRYRPGANGTKPCICICCERGSYGAIKLLRRVEEAEAAGRAPPFDMFGRDSKSWDRVERMKASRQRTS